MDQLSADFGSTSGRLWNDFGPTLGQLRANFWLTSGRLGTEFVSTLGQVTFGQIWVNFGMTLGDCGETSGRLLGDFRAAACDFLILVLSKGYPRLPCVDRKRGDSHPPVDVSVKNLQPGQSQTQDKISHPAGLRKTKHARPALPKCVNESPRLSPHQRRLQDHITSGLNFQTDFQIAMAMPHRRNSILLLFTGTFPPHALLCCVIGPRSVFATSSDGGMEA